jgi:hypothetical protein
MKILGKFYLYNIISMLRFYDDLIILGQKLRPRTYFKVLRINELNESNINHGDNVCIFIVYERGRIPEMTWNAIKSIKKMGIKVYLVINSKLVDEEKNKVREIADFSMFRNNTGKDIGGYKDAYLHLHNKGHLKLINKLIFANDSVVYPQKYIKELFNKLISSKSNMTGYSHVQEIHYHVQSFLFSCDNPLINDKLFIKFWSKYLPIDRRRYMINKGEVGLTKCVLKAGGGIDILNDISEILNQNLTIEKLHSYVTNLPTRSAHHIGILDHTYNLVDEYYRLYSEMIKDVKNNENQDLSKIILDDSKNYRKIKLQQFAYNFVNLISFRNNTHWNTFNFIELNLPVVIKRDSVYRAGYNYDHFKSYLKKYLSEESGEIMSMIKKPAASHFKGFKKIMFDNGII